MNSIITQASSTLLTISLASTVDERATKLTNVILNRPSATTAANRDIQPLSAELLKTLMPQIEDTKSKEVIQVDEAIRDKEKVKMFASPRLNILLRLMVKQATIALWDKKQWVCTW